MTSTSHRGVPGDAPARPGIMDRPATAVGVVVVASTVVALLAPDMVTGSEHEHLPLAALTVWPWTAASVGYVVMAARGDRCRDLVVGVAAVWTVVAVLALALPSLVTGTDPTRIPLGALLAPPFGAVVTAFLAIAHARSSRQT